MITVNLANCRFVMLTLILSLLIVSCEDDETKYSDYTPPHRVENSLDDSTLLPHPKRVEFEAINTDGVKILAIGNSYTNNATLALPWLLENIDNDEIFIAKLHRSGASLKMHWENHVEDKSDYEMNYSHGGKWHTVSITTIDEALQVFDWDIVVIQQMSAHSGLSWTYQPYLDNLKRLIRETDPNVRIAWQYAWAYTRIAEHYDFKKYFGNDPETMCDALISTQNMMTGDFDIRIPSAQLVKLLRDKHPEQVDGFSTDGIHLTEPACYALSLLWYETLFMPHSGHSCLEMERIPSNIPEEFAIESRNLVRQVLNEFNCSGVAQIH